MHEMLVERAKRRQAQQQPTRGRTKLAACNTLGENAWKSGIHGLYATQEPQLYA